MKRSFLAIAAIAALFALSGCSDKQHQVKAEAIEAGTIDVDNVSYFCVDGVRYIKYDDDEQFGVTVKFNKDGTVDTNCATEK
jgi:outer membrane protein assembly factor BamE (lipoprotein component of BamABCDE complex)